MIRFRTFHCIALVIALALSGCGRNAEGLRVLDDLRQDGLINDNELEPAPAIGVEPSPAQQNDGENIIKAAADGGLTLEELLHAVDRLNPRLVAARSRVGMAGAEAWQASLYPNPEFEIESENIRPSNGGFGVSETTLSVAQPIIISDRRTADVSAARSRINAERFAFDALRRALHGEVRREVAEIVHIRRAITLHQQLRELAGHTVNIAETRFEARAAPESEAIRARVDANNLELRIDALHGELAEAAERLATLLGGQNVDVKRIEPTSFEATFVEDVPTLDQLKAMVRQSHPSILAERSRIEAARRNVELERARRQPDITARLGAGVNHADDEGFVQAGLGVPLPIFNANQGNVLRARFELIAAQQQCKATANELVGTVGAAHKRWQSASQRLKKFRNEILGDAERAYDQARAGYQAGHLAFLDLLDAQRTLVDARITELDLIRAVNMALADIRAIIGAPVDGPEPKGDIK